MKKISTSPLLTVKEKYKTKEALVDKVMGLAPKQDGVSKDDLKKKLLKASNSKLLRLADRFAGQAK